MGGGMVSITTATRPPSSWSEKGGTRQICRE